MKERERKVDEMSSFLRVPFFSERGGSNAANSRREVRHRNDGVRPARAAVREVVLVGGGHAHVAVVKSFAMTPLPPPPPPTTTTTMATIGNFMRRSANTNTNAGGNAVRVTLVSRDVTTPYSGMLPGFVAGHYTLEECHIDLRRLVQRLGMMMNDASPMSAMPNASMHADGGTQPPMSIRLVHAECIGIDTERREVLLAGGRPAIRYDVLSVDVGITPAMLGASTSMHSNTVVAVKPIDSFCARWESLVTRFRESGGSGLRVAVVGGGAGGVELALAMHHRLTVIAQEMAADASKDDMAARIEFALFTRHEIMHTHGERARRIMRRIFGERGIVLHENATVADIDAERKELLVTPTESRDEKYADSALDGDIHDKEASEHDVMRFAFDECVWCTDARAASWIAASGLACESNTGCILINESLQSVSNQEVFAAGDCSHCPQHPRPKAGVFAVRAGMPLAENLRRYLSGRPLLPFTPQSTFLGLISTGNKYAVATKAGFAFEGSWMWYWKDYIDRTWMAQYGSDLFTKSGGGGENVSGAHAAARSVSGIGTSTRPSSELDALTVLSSPQMRCGGCGAKVGATVLSNVMRRLGITTSSSMGPSSSAPEGAQDSPYLYRRDEVLLGLGSPDDAAVVSIPRGKVTIQTIDFFRSFVSDLYVFGRIAANHALSDCHAMGAAPLSAMAIAMVEYSPDEAKMEEDLYQMMAGAASVLVEERCALVGGHTCEGAELGLGFAVVGAEDPKALMRKGGMRAGDIVLLTKPIGTGVLLAADMRGEAEGRWVQAALDSMQVSSREAAAILRSHGATSCTDVTGFGLLGHALEMARASDVAIEIRMEDVPLFDGALECVRRGIFSSLQPQNLRIARAVRWAQNESSDTENADDDAHLIGSRNPVYPLLFDPQTAGGLLASVPAASATVCIDALRAAGYAHTSIIGSVVGSPCDDDRCATPLILL